MDPGATFSLLPSAAAAEFFTATVNSPVASTVAVTLGTSMLICAARLRTAALAVTVVVAIKLQ